MVQTGYQHVQNGNSIEKNPHQKKNLVVKMTKKNGLDADATKVEKRKTKIQHELQFLHETTVLKQRGLTSENVNWLQCINLSKKG